MKPTRAPTIKSVAAELGVSVATISRALTRPEMVEKSTRERVLEGIERLGYRPNLNARDLRRGQTRAIFVVVPKLSPFFLEIFRGAEKAADELGFTVMMGHSQGNADREQAYFDQVACRRGEGIILLTGLLPSGAIARAQLLPPLVLAAEPMENSDLPTVRVDHEGGALEGVRHLIELGHRRIAHIGGPQRILTARTRLSGYQRALRDARIAFDEALVRYGDFTIASGQKAMHDLMQQKPAPTALFCANDEMAIGVIRALKELRLRVPEDVSIVGFDNQDFAEVYDPPLTTVHIPRFDVGYRAMMLLHDILAGKPRQVATLPTKLIIRTTTARAN